MEENFSIPFIIILPKSGVRFAITGFHKSDTLVCFISIKRHEYAIASCKGSKNFEVEEYLVFSSFLASNDTVVEYLRLKVDSLGGLDLVCIVQFAPNRRTPGKVNNMSTGERKGKGELVELGD